MLCEVEGGIIKEKSETIGFDYFTKDNLPILATKRIMKNKFKCVLMLIKQVIIGKYILIKEKLKMKKRYYFIIALVIFIPAMIVLSLIKDSHKKPNIKISNNEIVTSIPNCSEPTIKIDEIQNIKLLDNVEVGNKQVGYKDDKCYAGYFNTQLGTCFIYINPNIHSYIYFETKDDKCLINYESEEKTKELYETIKNI